MRFRRAIAADLPSCMSVRGRTRDNPLSPEQLSALGVTQDTWAPLIDGEQLQGFVAETATELVGFCFGDQSSGEVLVLAVLPDYEGRGIGRRLLRSATEGLFVMGHSRVWLAASPDPTIRAHGFYRQLGWVWDGATNEIGDQILSLCAPTG